MRVVSGVIIKSNNKVLMCKRSKGESLAGRWSIPSGHANPMESPLNAAKREFFEETNIRLKGTLKLIDMIKPKNGGIMYIYFKSSVNEIIPDLVNAKDGREHSECGYFTYDNLPFDKNDDDELYKIIRKVLGGK